MDILEEIIAHKRIEVEQFKQAKPERTIYREVEQLLDTTPSAPSMKAALMASDTGIIAEFKRKSPSKGWIAQEANANVVPLSYQTNGATAISILTDKEYFGGADEFVTQAKASGVELPILYKNFIIDEYQLFQAKVCGVSGVLLISSALKYEECKALLRTAHELQLEVLLEMHSEHDLDYCDIEPDMYGINNRNLGTLTTDVNNSLRLTNRLPSDVCKVSESGIHDKQTIMKLRLAGFNGFLIGERFMKEADPGLALKDFIGK